MTRTIRAYDYANRAVDIDIPDKEILTISIVVISGDETGTIYFKDGTSICFGGSDSMDRLLDTYDYSYLVTGSQIEAWINFEPVEGLTTSYERARFFLNTRKEVQTISEDMCCGQPFLSQAGQWICTEPGNYVFFDKTTDKVWRITEITNEVVFEEE